MYAIPWIFSPLYFVVTVIFWQWAKPLSTFSSKPPDQTSLTKTFYHNIFTLSHSEVRILSAKPDCWNSGKTNQYVLMSVIVFIVSVVFEWCVLWWVHMATKLSLPKERNCRCTVGFFSLWRKTGVRTLPFLTVHEFMYYTICSEVGFFRLWLVLRADWVRAEKFLFCGSLLK